MRTSIFFVAVISWLACIVPFAEAATISPVTVTTSPVKPAATTVYNTAVAPAPVQKQLTETSEATVKIEPVTSVSSSAAPSPVTSVQPTVMTSAPNTDAPVVAIPVKTVETQARQIESAIPVREARQVTTDFSRSGAGFRSDGLTVALQEWWRSAPDAGVPESDIGIDPVGGSLRIFWIDQDDTICTGAPGSGSPGHQILTPSRWPEMREKADAENLINQEYLDYLQKDKYTLDGIPPGTYIAQYANQVWRDRRTSAVFEDHIARMSLPFLLTITDTTVAPGTASPRAALRIYSDCFFRYSLPIPELPSGTEPADPTKCQVRKNVTPEMLINACREGRLEGSLSDGYMRILPPEMQASLPVKIMKSGEKKTGVGHTSVQADVSVIGFEARATSSRNTLSKTYDKATPILMKILDSSSPLLLDKAWDSASPKILKQTDQSSPKLMERSGEEAHTEKAIDSASPILIQALPPSELENPDLVEDFARAAAVAEPAVASVEVKGGSVKVAFDGKASLFGFIPLGYTLVAEGDAETGRVVTGKPWWLFLAKSENGEIERNLKKMDMTNEIGSIRELALENAAEDRALAVQMLANIMKTYHTTAMSAIRNMK